MLQDLILSHFLYDLNDACLLIVVMQWLSFFVINFLFPLMNVIHLFWLDWMRLLLMTARVRNLLKNKRRHFIQSFFFEAGSNLNLFYIPLYKDAFISTIQTFLDKDDLNQFPNRLKFNKMLEVRSVFFGKF